ncbi:MAG: metallophosphoesterase [Dehalococcoidia bacterium]|nr:metallophosphoesterase [Dehalococcoidia bacterium]
MPQTFFIADTHFDDSYAARKSPFRSRRIMNVVLYRNWNRKVSKYDTVYILGDFAVRHRWDYWKHILNGRKIFIKGNHDSFGDKEKEYEAFGGIQFLLLHDPCRVPPDYTGWAIHGHIHESYMVNKGRRLFCVSAMALHYSPINSYEVIRLVKKAEAELAKKMEPSAKWN